MEACLGTGDLLLFNRDSWQSSWFRAFTDTILEHSGIAIRTRLSPIQMIKSKGNFFHQVVSPGESFNPKETYLYVLDQMIKEKDIDVISGDSISGFRLATFESRRQRYRWITSRPLRDTCLSEGNTSDKFKSSFKTFCQKYYKEAFMKGQSNFIKFWLNMDTDPIYGKTCTMLTGTFIREVLQIDVPIILSPHHFDLEYKSKVNLQIDQIYHKRLQTIILTDITIEHKITPEILYMVLFLIFIFIFNYFCKIK